MSCFMPNLHSYIAWRYLFSRKGHNAINIVTGVSTVAVAVVTAAMVCVLSVMNGFGTLVEHMFSEFDPVLLVERTDGQAFRTDTLPVSTLYAMDGIDYLSGQLEQTALVRYKDHQLPARILGVDSLFTRTAHIDSIINDGFYSVWDGAFDRTVLGRGLASQLGVNAHFVGALHLYASTRTGSINMLRPDLSLRHEHAFIAGTFAVNQIEYDDQVMVVGIDLARRLFEYDSCSVTALRIQPKNEKKSEIINLKSQISKTLGPSFHVLDRYEQQADFFRILRIEKWLTVLLLFFILLIASFNIIGSLSMLIIDKTEDIRILSHLGADEPTIRRIFLCEGWLISSLGALIGLLVGVLLCLGQQHFGWLTLGDGTDYVISAYPVEVQAGDIVLVAAIVLLLGLVAAWYPSRKIRIPVVLLLLALSLASCTPTHRAPRGGLPMEYTEAWQTAYGHCYDSIPSAVVSLDLYSDGLSVDNEEHQMVGTGYNLYLSDIFVPDSLLSVGTYRSATGGEPYTFLPGRNWDGTPTGMYLLYVEEGQLQSIQVLDSGTMVVRDTTNRLLDLQFTLYYHNAYGYRYQYTTHYQGLLLPWQKK